MALMLSSVSSSSMLAAGWGKLWGNLLPCTPSPSISASSAKSFSISAYAPISVITHSGMRIIDSPKYIINILLICIIDYGEKERQIERLVE